MVLGILDSLFPQARQNVSQQNANDNKQGLGNRASNILSAFTNPTPSQAAKLAMGFNSLTLDPDPQFTAAMQKRIDDGSAMERANQTAMYLEQMGQTDLANLVRSGGISGADALSYISSLAKAKGTTYGSTGITKELLGFANTLADDYRQQMGNYNLSRESYNKVAIYYKEQTATSDYALAVAFAKMLDPISVVRQSEVDSVKNSASITQSLKTDILKTLEQDVGLPDSVRDEILRLSADIYNDRVEEAKVLEANTRERANALHPNLFDYVYYGKPVGEKVDPYEVDNSNIIGGGDNDDSKNEFIVPENIITPTSLNDTGLDNLSTLPFEQLQQTFDFLLSIFSSAEERSLSEDEKAFMNTYGGQEELKKILIALNREISKP